MSNFILMVFLCLLGWIKLAPKFKDFPAPTAIFKDFQGLECLFEKFKDFQGACEPWENLLLHFSHSLARLATPKTYKIAKYYRRVTPENKTFYLPLLSEAEHHLTRNFSVKVMLHGTIHNDDFLCNNALQCWNNVANAW